MNEWMPLTVSDSHFLDEITAALRDAKIEFRLVDPIATAQRGVRTSFGRRDGVTKVIEVPGNQLGEAQALLHEVFAGASEAAEREAGVPAATATEREEELAWRAAIERKRQRTDRIITWTLRALLAGIALVVAGGLLYRCFE